MARSKRTAAPIQRQPMVQEALAMAAAAARRKSTQDATAKGEDATMKKR